MTGRVEGRRSRRLAAGLAALVVAACTSTEPGSGNAAGQLARGDYGSYVVGRFANQIGDPRAADFLLVAADDNPANAVILNRAFVALLTDGRFREAVGVARRLRGMDAATGLSDMLLTLEAFRAGAYDEARAYFSDASGSGFESLIGPILFAWIAAAEGDRDKAFAALEPMAQAAALRPFEAAHRAYIYDYFGEAENAGIAYRAALDGAQLSSLQPAVSYAALLQRQDRTEEALQLLDQFREAFPGNEFIERERAALAAGERLKPVTRTPEGAVSLLLFRAAGELGRGGAGRPAILYARLASYLAPGLPDTQLRLAGLLAGEGLNEAALGVLAEVDRNDPLYEEARLQRAWIYQRTGETARALEELDDYLRQHPGNRQALATLGDVYRAGERYADAAQAYSRAIATIDGTPEREDWFLYFTRGISYERLGEWEKAEADMLQALELEPDQPQVLNYLGYSWIDRGMHLERGSEMIRRAVERRPEDGFIVDSLGWAHYLMGEYEEAVRHLERAVLLEPSDPTINDHLGDAYWKVGRKAEARFQWAHALAADPEPEARTRIAEKLEFGLELAEAADGS